MITIIVEKKNKKFQLNFNNFQFLSNKKISKDMSDSKPEIAYVGELNRGNLSNLNENYSELIGQAEKKEISLKCDDKNNNLEICFTEYRLKDIDQSILILFGYCGKDAKGNRLLGGRIIYFDINSDNGTLELEVFFDRKIFVHTLLFVSKYLRESPPYPTKERKETFYLNVKKLILDKRKKTGENLLYVNNNNNNDYKKEEQDEEKIVKDEDYNNNCKKRKKEDEELVEEEEEEEQDEEKIVKDEDYNNNCKKRKKEDEELVEEEEFVCMICQEFAPTTMVMPCHHVVVCESCSEKLKNTNDKHTCVRCRTEIEAVIDLQND